jgi:hypothetical protein
VHSNILLASHSHHAAIKSQHFVLSDSSVATRVAASLNHDFDTAKSEVSNKSTSLQSDSSVATRAATSLNHAFNKGEMY